MQEQLFTVEEVAERLKVHPESVRRWLRDGRMRGFRMARRAGWRVTEAEVRRFLEAGTHEGKLAAWSIQAASEAPHPRKRGG